MRPADRKCFGLLTALLFAVLSGVLLATAYTYSRSSGFFPKLIGWVFAGLVLLEVSLQLKSFYIVGRSAAADTVTAPALEKRSNVSREIKGFLWLGLLLVALYLVGFLIAIPLYVFAFLRISAAKSTRECSLLTILVSVFVYVVFVRLLQYQLFGGLLFVT